MEQVFSVWREFLRLPQNFLLPLGQAIALRLQK
jgi:hypothetical protein